MNNRRVCSIPTDFKIRENGEDIFIEGYFAVFNTRYEMWEGAAETVLKGAFTDTLGEDVRALINHNTDFVLGRTKAGTLELTEDDIGLFGRIKINKNDSDAMNLYARVQRGDVNQCSFGFDIIDETYKTDAQGNVLWELRKVKLYEVSVVTFPAYEETIVQARKNDLETIQKRKTELWRAEILKKLHGGTQNAESTHVAKED